MWKITVKEISLSSNICFPFLLFRPSVKTDGELQLVEKMLKSQPFNFTRVRKKEIAVSLSVFCVCVNKALRSELKK
jgi:hypothetical protein